jgi:hypothetical protein
MRRIKALPLLVVTAIVGAALVAPAGASAVEWHGGELEKGKPAPIEFNGPVEWALSGSGFTCPVHAAGTLSPGNKGEITAFDVDGTGGSSCSPFGAYAHCAITGTGTVPLSLEAKSAEEILLTKPKNKFGFTDKILWTWTFSNAGGECWANGQVWKIKADLRLRPLYTAGFWSSVENFGTVELLQYNKKGELFGTSTVGVSGKWAVTPFPTYTIN